MSFGKQKKEEIKPQILSGPSESAARSKLTSLLESKYQPYTGKVFADFPQKEKLIGLQESFINRPTDPFYSQAQSAIGQIVRGETDPRTSPLYAGLRQGLLQNQQDALNEFYRQQQAKGILDSTGTNIGGARLIGDTTSKINEILGGLYETERGRVLPAISQGANIADYLSGQDLTKAQGLTSISGLLKSLEEEPLQYALAQYMAEQNYPFEYIAPIAQALLANPETFYFPQYTTKKTGIGQLIGGIGGAALGSFAGPAGATAGYGIGSQIGDLIYA